MARGEFGPTGYGFYPAHVRVLDGDGNRLPTYSESGAEAPPNVDNTGRVSFWIEAGTYTLELTHPTTRATETHSVVVTAAVHAPAAGSGSLSQGPIPPALLAGTVDPTPRVYTWQAGDEATGTAVGTGGLWAEVLRWTPTESGVVALPGPPDDGVSGDVEWMVYDAADLTDSGLIDAAGQFIGIRGIIGYYHQTTDQNQLVAGTEYVLAVFNNDGSAAVGRTIDYTAAVVGVQILGGVAPLAPWRSPTGELSWAEGYGSIAEGHGSHAAGAFSRAEGEYSRATGYASHAEGYGSYAEGHLSHAEGSYSHAQGTSSHAEGPSTLAQGSNSYAEGVLSRAEGPGSHAEGYLSRAAGLLSHAEGTFTVAEGDTSHVEGENTHAVGYASHAEGRYSYALNDYSHARGGGIFTRAGDNQYQSVQLSAETSNAVTTPLIVRYGEMKVYQDRVLAVRAMVAARKQDGSAGAAWQITAAVRTDFDGTPTVLGTPTVTLLGADAAASTWTVVFSAALGYLTTYLRLLVSGQAATSIHWSATLQTQEVG